MIRRLFGLAAVIALIGGGLWVYRYLDGTLFGLERPDRPAYVTVRIPRGRRWGNRRHPGPAGVGRERRPGRSGAHQRRRRRVPAGDLRLHTNEPYGTIIKPRYERPAPRRSPPRRSGSRCPRACGSARSRRRSRRGSASPEVLPAAVPGRDAAAGYRATGKERLDHGGLPLPGDVRPARARRARAGSSAEQLDAFRNGDPQVDFAYARRSQPDALRRPHHRLAGRARGGATRATGPRSRP